MERGLRSLRDLTQHLTARADDSHATAVTALVLLQEYPVTGKALTCQTWVRFFGHYRINPHAPPLVRAPVNSFEFQPCGRTPQAGYLTRLLRHGRGRDLPHLVSIVYGVDYRGI